MLWLLVMDTVGKYKLFFNTVNRGEGYERKVSELRRSLKIPVDAFTSTKAQQAFLGQQKIHKAALEKRATQTVRKQKQHHHHLTSNRPLWYDNVDHR